MRLLDLTWYQRQHDQNYHHDVWIMPAMGKISHLTHHLNKYITRIGVDKNAEIDIFVTVLSMSTVFPTNLGTVIASKLSRPVTTIDQVEPLFNPDESTIQHQLRVHVSHLSKLVEGFDHIESINYREQINSTIAMLFILSMQLFYLSLEIGRVNYKPIYSLLESPLSTNRPYMNSILLASYHARLLEIRNKNPFHKDYLTPLMQGTVNKTTWGIIHETLDKNLVALSKP